MANRIYYLVYGEEWAELERELPTATLEEINYVDGSVSYIVRICGG